MNRILKLLFPFALAAPLAAQGGFLGVQMAQGDAGQGVLIDSVVPRSAAAVVELLAGDRILAINGEPVSDPLALGQAVAAKLPGELLELTVMRGDIEFEQMVILGRRAGSAKLQAAPFRGQLEFGDLGNPEIPDELREMFEQLEGRGAHPQSIDATVERLRELGLAEEGAEVRAEVVWPASTPQEEQGALRERLADAFGDRVEVRFEGEGYRMTATSGGDLPGLGLRIHGLHDGPTPDHERFGAIPPPQPFPGREESRETERDTARREAREQVAQARRLAEERAREIEEIRHAIEREMASIQARIAELEQDLKDLQSGKND